MSDSPLPKDKHSTDKNFVVLGIRTQPLLIEIQASSLEKAMEKAMELDTRHWRGGGVSRGSVEFRVVPTSGYEI